MLFQQFGLHADLLKALHKFGYKEPTPIQQKALPLALTGRDLIGCAQTGTGKTAAFALPILNKLHGDFSGKTRALILTPTRELAAQVHDVFKGLAAYSKLYTAAIFGGVGQPPQERALRLGTDVIVATPGRLLDLLKRGVGNLRGVEFFVLDEADRMLDMGFLPDVKRILSYLPKKRQTMMFSATMPKEILELSRQILHEPEMIQVGRQSAPAEGVKQSAYPINQRLKFDLLLHLLREAQMSSVLVFARTKMRTDRLTRQLKDFGFAAACLHGDRTQGQRIAALEGFRSGDYRILVATDIAARGIDIEGISHVVNFDVPVAPEDYVHRIGRTARARAIGEAVTLVAPEEEGFVASIQRLTKSEIPHLKLSDFDYHRPATATRPEQPDRFRRKSNTRHEERSGSHAKRNGSSPHWQRRRKPGSANGAKPKRRVHASASHWAG